MRGLSAPFLLLLGLSFTVLALLAGLMTYTQNQNAVEASEHTFDALITDRFKRLSNIVLEYGYWDEAVEMIVYNYDADWTAGTFGEYFAESLDIDGAHVIDGAGDVVMGFFKGKPDRKSLAERYGEGLSPIIARARESKDDTSPWPRLGITHGNDHYFMIAAIRMTTYLTENGEEVDRSTDHVLFLSQRLDAGYLGTIARKYLMPGLKIVDHPAGLWQADKEIKDPSGNVFAYFFWEPELPGTEMMPQIVGGVAAVFVIMGITAWYFFRRVTIAASELEQARAAADAANQAKTDFLRNVTHEIRTPINAIVGFSTIMRDEMFGPVGNDRYIGYINDIANAGEHILQLVGDLLDLSKIEAGEMSFEIETVNLREQIDATVSLVQPLADERRVLLLVDESTEGAIARSDPRLVRQILMNLLSNAIKFTPEGGEVVCRAVQESGDRIRIEVSDTGRGVSPDQIERILKPFGQVAAAQTGVPRGTGLGLPITKKMIESLGGEFVFESEVGRGTTVKVTFPQDG